jgi:glycolate oxidase subunit GlcD
MTTSTIDIQPGALLATAPAATPISHLNQALAAHGLCLPIMPLVADLTLEALVAHNAGGRRQLRHGTIARYLRAATVTHGQTTLVVGGPTLKRATGYGLNRALVGNNTPDLQIHDVTLSLRPLPAAHQGLLIAFDDMGSAFDLAHRLIGKGLNLSALAVRQVGAGAQLLVELEGMAAVLEQQAAIVQQAVGQGTVTFADWAAWQPWEDLAARWIAHPGQRLSISLPRLQLPTFIEQARTLTNRYGMALDLWGDAGLGMLHLALNGRSAGEQQQAAALLLGMAHNHGGALATELGPDTSTPVRLYTGSPAHLANAASPLGERSEPALAALAAIVGPRYVLTRPEDLGTYEKDASIARASGRPLAIVLPANTAEVSQVLAYAAEAGLNVVTRGAGSGLAGGSTPSEGALVLALSRLDTIALDAEQMVVRVGAGAVTADVQRAAEARGLYYPPDPSSLPVSTVGGNIACNAGGPRCLKYGVTADYVLALTAVLATIVQFGDGLIGQSPDMGQLHLLVGSEGTLAVITEATLRLIPLPPARRTTLAIFDRLDDACSTVEAIMAGGIIPAGLELMDATTIIAVEEYLQLGLPRDAGAMLLLLADGDPIEVAAEATALAEYARRGGARSVQVAQNSADEAALWRARRAVAPALARIRPNRLGEDICVPVSRIAECVRQVQTIAAANDLPIVVFGHAGDGNLHPNILFDSRDPAQVERVWQAAGAIFTLALDLGGTLSGEHGIGTLKRPFMVRALGEELLDYMWAIKRQFDPQNRLNPGKVLPE